MLALPAAASEFAGKVRVIDGDTIDVGKVRVRIHGIDAPERDQPCTTLTGQNWGCGDWVTRQVRDRYQGVQARCVQVDTDKYGRAVARCHVAGSDMAQVLVRSGWAFAYRKYAVDYVSDEQAAYAADLGIHGFTMQSPARYRLTRGRPEQVGSAGCKIKGNISRKGARIYHMPEDAFYTRTWITEEKGERWFCSEAQARASGWRAAKR